MTRTFVLASFAVAGVLASATLASAQTANQSLSTSAEARVAADVAKVNEQYLVGPQGAMNLNCRVKWQTTITIPNGGALKLVTTSPQGILALTNRNELTLVRSTTGERAWTGSAADPIDRVVGLGIFDYATRTGNTTSRIAVLTDALFYGLDIDSGAALARTRFKRVPSTGMTQFGNMFIFGTSSGQVSWFNCATGNDTRGHVVDALRGGSPLTAAPAVGEGVIVAGSHSGGVVGLNARTGELLWKKHLLAGVSATPAIQGGVAFVASDDQYLYAFDLANGATLWKHFTQTPLRTSPFIAGELVLQDVPGEGLLAFTQNPEAQPGGEIRWKRASVCGTPFAMMGDSILFWCSVGHEVTVVNLKDGQTTKVFELPSVDHLEPSPLEDGGFIAWSADGRVERLSPIASPSSSAAPAAPAAPASTTASGQ